MRKLLPIIGGLLIVATGCSQKDDTPIEEKNLDTFIASAESIGTKTSMVAGDNSYSLVWENNDKISVSDGSSVVVFSKVSSGSDGEIFRRSANETFDFSASKFVAFYPSSISVSNMVLPSEQLYCKDNVRDYPMYD